MESRNQDERSLTQAILNLEPDMYWPLDRSDSHQMKKIDLTPIPRTDKCQCGGDLERVEQVSTTGIVRVFEHCEKCGTTISWPENR